MIRSQRVMAHRWEWRAIRTTYLHPIVPTKWQIPRRMPNKRSFIHPRAMPFHGPRLSLPPLLPYYPNIRSLALLFVFPQPVVRFTPRPVPILFPQRRSKYLLYLIVISGVLVLTPLSIRHSYGTWSSLHR